MTAQEMEKAMTTFARQLHARGAEPVLVIGRTPRPEGYTIHVVKPADLPPAEAAGIVRAIVDKMPKDSPGIILPVGFEHGRGFGRG